MKRFEVLDHTADICIRVNGATLNQLFVNAQYALISLLAPTNRTASIHKTIHIESEALEDLMVQWLNEILARFYIEHFLVGGCMIDVTVSPRKAVLSGTIAGQALEPIAEHMHREIKAATYHGLRVQKVNGIYTATIIFDV